MVEPSASAAEILSEADPQPPTGATRGTDAARPKPTHRGFVPRADDDGLAPVAAAPDDDFDWGQAIDDPPPFVEPMFIGFESDDAPEPAAVMPAADAKPALEPKEAPEPELDGEPEPDWDEELEPEEEPAPESLYAEEAEARYAPDEADVEHSEPAAERSVDEAQPWWREPQEDAHPITGIQPVRPPQEAAAAPPTGSLQWLRWPLGLGQLMIAVLVIGLGAAGFGAYNWVNHRFAPRPALAPLPEAPSDPAKRLIFYETRAKAGDAEAQLELAIVYAKGEGVPQNYTTAATWFRAAAEQGVPRAQYDLGVLCERGRGIPQDYAEAFKWYSRAAEANFPLAQYNLAVAYTRGQGTKQDFTTAAGWYRRAAIQGVVPAMVNLAILYERGEGVTASTIEAYAWYRAAASRGNQPSAKRAAELYDILAQVDRTKAEARAATVIATLPAATPEEAAAAAPAPPAPPAKLKSGLGPELDEGSGTSPATTAQ